MIAMNIEKYTQNAQSAVIDAQNLAIEYGNPSLEPCFAKKTD